MKRVSDILEAASTPVESDAASGRGLADVASRSADQRVNPANRASRLAEQRVNLSERTSRSADKALDPADKALRPDLAEIARWVAPNSRVLDLGCGDGSLMAWLQSVKHCTGYGVEIDDRAVLSCVRRGVDVVQRDIEAGLGMFGHDQFDIVVLSMAIQATHETEQVLREMSQVGREGIVSFPNFGHWYHAWSILRGRMPVSREMPYEWFNTPNLHLATVRDFEDFLGRLGLVITARAYLANGRPVIRLPSLRSTQAIYRFRRAA